MATLERTYNVPLRKAFRKAPKYKRAKRAVNALRKFIARHMKSPNIKIGRHLNQEIWKHGIQNPPHHVKVTLIKDDEGLVKAELFGFKYEEMTKEEMEKIEEKKEEKKPAKKEKEVTELEKEIETVAKEIKKEPEKKPEPKVEEKKPKPAKKEPAKKTKKTSAAKKAKS